MITFITDYYEWTSWVRDDGIRRHGLERVSLYAVNGGVVKTSIPSGPNISLGYWN